MKEEDQRKDYEFILKLVSDGSIEIGGQQNLRVFIDDNEEASIPIYGFFFGISYPKNDTHQGLPSGSPEMYIANIIAGPEIMNIIASPKMAQGGKSCNVKIVSSYTTGVIDTDKNAQIISLNNAVIYSICTCGTVKNKSLEYLTLVKFVVSTIDYLKNVVNYKNDVINKVALKLGKDSTPFKDNVTNTLNSLTKGFPV